MKKIPLLFFIVLLLISISWYNVSPGVIISRLSKSDGIKMGLLRYRIYLFKVLPVGEAIFSMEKIEEYGEQKVYHLNASANNLKSFSRFFNAQATLDSYIDMRQLNPILFKERLIVTGKPDLYKEVFYDQVNHIMSIGGVRRQILPNTQDLLSTIFNLRRMDFNQTKTLEISINTNQKNYILKGRTRADNLLIRKQIYKIVLLEGSISRRDKNPYHKSNVSMVLLEEGGNIPILINVFTKGIFINVRLIDIK